MEEQVWRSTLQKRKSEEKIDHAVHRNKENLEQVAKQQEMILRKDQRILEVT